MVGVADAVGVAEVEGQGVGEALLVAVAEGLADVLGDGFGVGVGVAVAVAEAEGVGVAAGAQMLGMADGASNV